LFPITGDAAYVQYLDKIYTELKTAINTKAWDGEWYARALSSKGVIGSTKSEGSKLYLNPQVWAVLANLPDEDQMKKLLASVDSMEHDFGFPINVPAYDEFSPHVGRMGLMLPGLYENGGVYCHASAFKIMMDAKTGRSEEAIRTMKKLIPDSQWNPYTQSETEPYVFTNCYAIHPGCYGKADRSWITGTSAWCLKSFYEGILGIQKDYNGLKIDPCLPADWLTVKATREFRGSFYQFTIHNPHSLTKGKLEIKMDGKLIVGNILPLDKTPARHTVEINIRK
jgi:cellobiose phosphorylase